MATVPNLLSRLQSDASVFNACYDVLASFNVMLSKDDAFLQWDVLGGPRRVLDRLAGTDIALTSMKAKYVAFGGCLKHAGSFCVTLADFRVRDVFILV